MKFNYYGVAVALSLFGCALPDDDIDAELAVVGQPGNHGSDHASAHDIDGSGAEQIPASGPPPPLLGQPAVTCPGARLIGVLMGPNEGCDLGGTLPPNWDGYRMFEEASPGVKGLTAPVPSELARYCVFERESPPMSPDDYIGMFQAIDLAPTMALTEVAVDCMGEFAQADLNDAAVVGAMELAFDKNVDRVVDLLGTSWARKEIDVTLLDTVSQSAVNPANEHAWQLGALIERIACPVFDPGCSDGIGYVLAMPRETWVDAPDWIDGGHHGTQGDIALAIYQAVGEWRARLSNPGAAKRLVLNLSLGWERDAPDVFNEGRGATMALLSALEYARCQGALVFTAAGNNPDPSCPELHTGPLAPAEFEKYPALDSFMCASKGFGGGGSGLPIHGGVSTYRPLVYAVGGVDGFDEPLINSREDGQPRLVATGANGVAASSSYKALTGTSVASAVASATAALIWSYDRNLTPDDVAALLYDTGWATGPTADFALSGVPAVRRLSVCAALDQACASHSPAWCPHLGCSAQAPDADGGLGPFSAEVDTVLASATIDAFAGSSGAAPVCSPSNWSNLADPQPEVPVCPYCNIDVPPAAASTDPDDVLSMSIHPDYASYTILDLTMTLYDSTRTETTYSFDSAVIASLNNGGTGVTTVTFDVPDTIAASLEFELLSPTGVVSTQLNGIVVN
ncbi:S8/S53 family peptidase [Enhygromyxa salina]|nr:S8/S53 family peptidase [Enhygromyxa salina]